ncbi:unnamed protein product [Cyprideis torosa]|uniref:Uncharacterized protein n=1 Tax=Cyprideis torosa TaxID=163714 RepID=A0A7R8ZQL2_9CRUS|nr:unnamed protein product [Cyprideis torosa]CAG0890960.1 unnamed protein product [Cyprideis torosa]
MRRGSRRRLNATDCSSGVSVCGRERRAAISHRHLHEMDRLRADSGERFSVLSGCVSELLLRHPLPAIHSHLFQDIPCLPSTPIWWRTVK